MVAFSFWILWIWAGLGAVWAWRWGVRGREKVSVWRVVVAAGLPLALLGWHWVDLRAGSKAVAEGLIREGELMERVSMPWVTEGKPGESREWSRRVSDVMYAQRDHKAGARGAKHEAEMKALLDEVTAERGVPGGHGEDWSMAFGVLIKEGRERREAGDIAGAVRFVAGADKAGDELLRQRGQWWRVRKMQQEVNAEVVKLLPRVTRVEDLEPLARAPLSQAVLSIHRAYDREAGWRLDSWARQHAGMEMLRWGSDMALKRDEMHLGLTEMWVDWKAGHCAPEGMIAELLGRKRCLGVMAAVARKRLRSGELPRGLEELEGEGLVNLNQAEPVVTLVNEAGVVTVTVRVPTGMSPQVLVGKTSVDEWDARMVCDFSGGK